MATSKPRITGTTHILPFDRLSADDFERLCLWLIKREGFKDAEHLGASGNEQGRDIIAWNEGEQWAFQCKRVIRFGFNTAKEEIDKILNLPKYEIPSKYVFIASCNISDNTRRQIRTTYPELEFEFWAQSELDEKVNGYPSIKEEFFQIRDFREKFDKNRENMLQLVWNTWIEGVLKQSLHNEVLINLDMETRPNAVEHPWDMIVQMPNREPEHLPPGTTMLDLLDQSIGSLLILGEPGSGKTTMLLELCRLLIERAKEDSLQQIPVVFNLSSWNPEPKMKPNQTFANWLVNELNIRYYIPNKVGRRWIENDTILLLLDGLDEVMEENREICVRAINAFRARHNMPIVVCSRRQEYEALNENLNLKEAVLIQPLTNQQVDDYLKAAGAELTRVNQALLHDPELKEFTHTPLILSIHLLAYQDDLDKELIAMADAENYRKHLFEDYIARMFSRRGKDQQFTINDTEKWLSWLAREMVERNQSIFHIEDILTNWLPFPEVRTNLIFGLIFGLITGVTGLIFGLGFGSGVHLSASDGLSLGIPMFLVGMSIGMRNHRPNDRFIWSWKNFFYSFALLYIFFSFGFLISGFNETLIFVWLGLLAGVFSVMIGMTSVSINSRSGPGEGIKNSLGNFLFYSLFFGLIIGLFFMLSFELAFHWGPEPGYYLLLGVVTTMIIGLHQGGSFVIQHFISRWFLYRFGHIPWNLVTFLNYCHDRIFLRRVGGGYIFIHRMLMEHFAEIYAEQFANKNA